MSTRLRTSVFLLVIYTLMIVFLEGGARVYFYVREGFNPYYLLYGFIADTQWHSREERGYSKFQPNSVYRQKLGDETLQMHINSDGFRGAEIAKPKPPGTIRVACLGASSTFGYNDPDDATYPFLLERMLRESLPGQKVEVLNLGIPHLRLSNIVPLARHELPALQPDIVVFYEGYNNSILIEDRSQGNLLFKIKDWFNFHSVAWMTIHELVRAGYYRVASALNRDIAGLPNLDVPIVMNEQEVRERRQLARDEFRKDLDALGDVTRQLGAQFVLVTQTFSLSGLERNVVGPEGYYEELAGVERELATTGGVLAPRLALLIHHDLMDELRDYAKQHSLTLVEGIDALDHDRPALMASFVHLTPRGNEVLAGAIRDGLIRGQVLKTASRS